MLKAFIWSHLRVLSLGDCNDFILNFYSFLRSHAHGPKNLPYHYVSVPTWEPKIVFHWCLCVTCEIEFPGCSIFLLLISKIYFASFHDWSLGTGLKWYEKDSKGGLPEATSSCGHTCQRNGRTVAEEYVVEGRETNDDTAQIRPSKSTHCT